MGWNEIFWTWDGMRWKTEWDGMDLGWTRDEKQTFHLGPSHLTSLPRTPFWVKTSDLSKNWFAGYTLTKIQGFEGKAPGNRLFGAWFWKYITFVWAGVIQQYLYSIKVWYKSLCSPRRTPSMCTQHAQSSFFLICRLMAILSRKFSRPPMCLMGAHTGPTF